MARSSTATHYSEEFTTATVGELEDNFYGIPLSPNPFTNANTHDIIQLVILVLAIVVIKPALNRWLFGPVSAGTASENLFSIFFWSCAFVAAYSLKEFTLYPLLATLIGTRTSYPYMVLISHCLSSLCAYRTERELRDATVSLHFLESFLFTFFCYGFGGSIVSDLLLGLPVTAVAHARILPCYTLCYVMVYHAPFDVVYRTIKSGGFFTWFVTVWESVDGVTTAMGRTSRAARELSNRVGAPIAAGLVAGTGGAALRYFERVVLYRDGSSLSSVSERSRSSREAMDAAFWKSLGISLLWWYLAVYRCENTEEEKDQEANNCSSLNGSDTVRVVLVGSHVVWTLVSGIGWLNWTPFGSVHPLGWLIKDGLVVGLGSVLDRVFSSGPIPKKEKVEKEKMKNKKKNKGD